MAEEYDLLKKDEEYNNKKKITELEQNSDLVSRNFIELNNRTKKIEQLYNADVSIQRILNYLKKNSYKKITITSTYPYTVLTTDEVIICE